MNSCGVPCGTDSERTYARQAKLCGGKGVLHSRITAEVARELIPPQGGGRPDGICRPSSKGVTAVFCEPEAEKNSVKRGIIPL